MYKVCLMGASLSTGNMGVSALAASLVKLIQGVREDAHISFFIGERTSTPQEMEVSGRKIQIGVINYRLSPRARVNEHLFWIFFLACIQRIVPFQKARDKIVRFNPCLRALLEADFVGDIRGGDSFSDIYGIKNFIIGSMPSIITLLLNKNLVLLPQTYGPYKSPIARYIARFIMQRATCVLSRDREGIEIANRILDGQASKKPVHFCPDVGFIMDSVAPNKLNISPPIARDQNVPLVGFNINGLLYNGGYTRDNMFGLKYDYKLFVHKLAERLMEETPAHLLLIPHTFAPNGHVESDPDACRDVLNSLRISYKDRIHLAIGQYNQFEIKGIIGMCDFFIGSRMHACIAALSQGIATIGIGYSRKFTGVCESVGQRRMVLDARFMDIESTIESIFEVFRKQADSRKVIAGSIGIAQGQIKESFERLLLENDCGSI